ncbi:MAG: acyl-ACP--UDP-N-acetylglucosamine O-acyltransferase [Methylobacterium mesophilicum]|nr:acyl-ACP--UDP-N-acetylglucosamine O-acyltransferase [Methylobacterium mesophilicum]
MQAEVSIHPSAFVEKGAQLGTGVSVGPFCHVSADAVLEDNVSLASHVAVMGATTLGAGCKVFPQAVLGAAPQNAKHRGGRTTLVVGANTIIREAVTMHAGTDTSRGETIIGENGNFLAYAHIAHDCIVGRNCTFANGATLGGHCEIGDNVNIGGLTAVHQFVRIGDGAFVGGCSAVVGDVIPFGIAAGNRAKLRGLNIVGLRRSGMSRAEIHQLRQLYLDLFSHEHTLAENIERVGAASAGFSANATKIFEFLTHRGKRQYTVPPLAGALLDDDASE